MTAPTPASTGPTDEEWAAVICPITGAMAPAPTPFAGVPGRLRPDGRPMGELRDELRRIDEPYNALVVATIPAGIALNAWLALAIGRWFWWPVAVLVAGTMFARLFILNHEAAHRMLFRNRTVNDAVMRLTEWSALGTGTSPYRRIHAAHHKDEFGPKEPDLSLYARYPISRASMRRKLTRDALFISGWKNIKGFVLGAFRPGRRLLAVRFFGGQAVVWALFWALSGHWWTYWVLWVLPNLTVWRVINRLRAIAEHGGMTRSADRRRTTHHVRQTWLAKAVMVPFNTGYHVAHHADAGVPWKNLPRYHRELEAAGYFDDVTVWPNYRSLWREMAAGSEPT